MNRTPAYRIVYSDIKQKIVGDTYSPGSMIPTETQLQEEYGVSRTTVRKAISMLAHEGYLSIRQGHGTVVLEKATTQSLNSITTLTGTLIEQGFDVTVQGMHIEMTTAPEIVCKELHLESGSSVYRIQRVLCADGSPVAFSSNYFQPNLLPHLEEHENKFVSIYKLLEEQYRLTVTEADEVISAMACGFIDAQILQIPQGTPILRSQRTSRCDLGPLEYSDTKILADKYKYSIHMERGYSRE